MQPVSNVAPQIRSTLEQYRTETRAPGLSISVCIRGEVVHSIGSGLADVGRATAVTPATMFRIGSVSKSLTATAVGLLFEQGRLDIDAPIQRYVPSFPEKQYPITTRHLAGHLSGLPHYQASELKNVIRYSGVLAALDKFKDKTLLFKPGDRYCYSSFGYNLLGAVVEGAAETPFLTFMDQEIFQRLGMKSTQADHVDEISHHRTSFYQVVADRVEDAPFTDNSDVWPAGGFLSTPRDLVVFASGLIEGKLLRSETVRLLFEPMRTTSGEVTGYGFGWQTEEMCGRDVVRNDGGHFGATTSLVVFPKERTSIAMTANIYHERLFEIVERVADLLVE